MGKKKLPSEKICGCEDDRTYGEFGPFQKRRLGLMRRLGLQIHYVHKRIGQISLDDLIQTRVWFASRKLRGAKISQVLFAAGTLIALYEVKLRTFEARWREYGNSKTDPD